MIYKPLAWKGSQAPRLTKGLEVPDLISHLVFFLKRFFFNSVFPHFLLYAAKQIISTLCFGLFVEKCFFDKFLNFYQSEFTGQQCNFHEHCGL